MASASTYLAFMLLLLISLASLAAPAQAVASDLTVDSIWLEKASQPGQAVTLLIASDQFNIVATVKNLGNAPASGYYLDVYYDSDYGRGGPDNVAAGETQIWYVGPLTAQSGAHAIQWIIDPDNTIAESNENNNVKPYTFTVGSTTTTTTATSTTTYYSTSQTTTQTPGPIPIAPIRFGSTASAILNSPPSTVYFILPDSDSSHTKALGVGQASVTDWTALGYVYGMVESMPQVTVLDTNGAYVDAITGAPKIRNSTIILFGGPLVNVLTHYYEDNGIAPLKWSLEGSWSTGTEYYRTRSGAEAARIPLQTVAGGSQDYAMLEVFKDQFGNSVMIFAGFGWKGTFAGGLYFKTVLCQSVNLASLTDSWYFYSWRDTNGNGFADYNEVNPTTSTTTSTSTLISSSTASSSATQTSTTQTLSPVPGAPIRFGSTASAILNSPPSTVYFILPDSDSSHTKALGVGQASVTDWTALGYVYGMVESMPQVTVLDTNGAYVDAITGAPKIRNSTIILFGGPLVNVLTHYYEDNGIAPLKWSLEGSWSTGTEYYRTRSGAEAARIPLQTVAGGSQDYAMLEVFKDQFGNSVMIFAGFGWKGTFAGGLYFKTVLCQSVNLASLTDSWYFYSWRDTNGNGFADYNEVNPTTSNSGN